MATVLIWNNNMVATGHRYPGHAAMSIDDSWNFNPANYVSFWAGGSGGSLFGSAAPGDEASLRDDLTNEGYAPDHIIRVQGVDVGAAQAEWRQVKTEFKKYRMLRENCSAAVARVLTKASRGGSLFQRHSVIWTPLNVKRLAVSMGGVKLGWEALVRELHAAGVLPREQVSPLALWEKRDARHGSSTNRAIYQGGQKIDGKTKTTLPWTRPVAPKFIPVSNGAMLVGEQRTQAISSYFDMLDAFAD